MRTKLGIWLSCTVVIVALIVSGVLVLIGEPEAALCAAGAALCFAILAAILTRDLNRWREQNERYWAPVYEPKNHQLP